MKLIIIVGLLINQVSVELIDLLRRENCQRLMFVVNWMAPGGSPWKTPSSAVFGIYGVDGIITEFKISE